MFGKINFGFASQNKPQQNTAQDQQKNASQRQNLQNKSFLSNPTFKGKLHKKNDITAKNRNKQKQQDGTQQINNNKTKQIKKPTNAVPFQKQQKSNKKQQPNSLQHQMKGSKFRILNELLYTTSSQQAMSHFQQHPEDYQTYHEGYRYQSQKWQSKPVNVLIKYFRKSWKQYKDKTICDLGCGEGFLYEGLTKEKYQKENEDGSMTQVKNKHVFKPANILSFDLISLKPFIKVADISNLPLQPDSIDVAVFCLSLMGKNYIDFIQQAHRVLKKQTGQLIIAEVESRSKNWRAFIEMIEMVGFRLMNNGISLGSTTQPKEQKQKNNQPKNNDNGSGRYFRMLHFTKLNEDEQLPHRIRFEDKNYTKSDILELSQLLLTQCIYKKR